MAVATFAIALVARLGFRLLADEPLLFAHQHTYFWSGLRIAEQAHPVDYVLRSDDWRAWGRGWTLAPLYQLFLAAFFRLDGARLLPVQVAQCVMGALTAVLVGDLGRRLAPRLGAWAGIAYALYWPSITFASRTMTENLHTVLLVAGLWTLSRCSRAPSAGAAACAGYLLGASALARAVSAAFVPIAALWPLLVHGWRRGLRDGALVGAGACLAILPWTARNAFFQGDPVLIETLGVYNLWNDNAFVDEGQLGRQEQRMFNRRNRPAETRALAVEYALRGIAGHSDAFLDKVRTNLRFLVRPDTTHGLLIGLSPVANWWELLNIPLGDFLMLFAIPPFLVFAVAGGRSPERTLLLAWLVYYSFLLVVVFHVETRYRSPLAPFFFVFAAAGLEQLLASAERRRAGVRAALVAGCAIVAFTGLPYLVPAFHAARSWRAAARADAAWRAGERGAALEAIAAAGDDNAARPWLDLAGRQALRGESAGAVEAFRQVEELAPGHLVPTALLPRLLLDVGLPAEAEQASEEARRLSWALDPWLVLENAWRRLPPPKTAEITLGFDDYGAVRGFLHPNRNYRWTRGRAWLRLAPPWPERDVELRLEMGSPEPSPFPHPRVLVRACGGEERTFELTREVRPYVWRADCSPGSPVVIDLRAPTFNRAGEHDDQGVRVDRLSVRPAAR